jgi:hypothetical protein
MAATYSTFRTVEYGPYTVRVMDGAETGGIPLLVSVAGPGLPRLRLTVDGPQPFGPDDEPLPDGLIVFGSHKWDRPRLGQPDEDEPPADARLDVRLDADLKAWTLEHGGSQLIRDLLRQARNNAPDAGQGE